MYNLIPISVFRYEIGLPEQELHIAIQKYWKGYRRDPDHRIHITHFNIF